MAIRFKCGKCGKGIKVPDGTAGKPTVCGGCGHQQVIPAPAPEAPAPDAPKETAAATPPKPEPPAPPKDPAEESWAINLSQEEPGEPTDALAALAGATRAEDDAAPAAAGQPEKEVPLAVDAEAESAAAPEGDEAVAAEQEGSKKRHKAIPMFTCAYCGQFFPMGQVIEEDDQTICKDCYVAAATAASAPAAMPSRGHSRYGHAPQKSRKGLYLTLAGCLIAAIILLLFMLKGEVEPGALPEPPLPLAFAGPSPGSEQQRVNRAREGVVRVHVEIALTIRETGLEFRRVPVGRGSGFFVSSDGLVVTNYHVVHIDPRNFTRIGVLLGIPLSHDQPNDEWTGEVKQGDNTYTIVARSNIVVQLLDDTKLNAEILELEATRDLGLLKVAFKGAQKSPPVLNLLAEMPEEVGGAVYSIGTPMDAASPNTVAEGKISGFTNYYKESSLRVIQSSAHTNPGSSGGALVGADGEVEGVTTYILRKPQPLTIPRPGEEEPDPDDPPAKEPNDFQNDDGKTVFNFTMPAREAAKFVEKRGVKAWPRIAKAWTAMREKRWSEAVSLLTELTGHKSFHNQDGDAWYALGDAMLHQSNTDWGKAREAFESASVFYPDADAGRQAEAFYAVGFVLQKQDRHEDAIKRFDQALQRDNRQGKAHYARALSLMHLKKRDEAVAALKQASSSEGNAGVKAREALQMLGE